jgi:hypothetical protein
LYSWADQNHHDALTDVWYVPPYAGAPTNLFEHHVHLFWDNPFPLGVWAAAQVDPAAWLNTARISRIDIATFVGGGLAHANRGRHLRKLVRTYELSYETNPTGIPTYRSFLSSAQMFDGCNDNEGMNEIVPFPNKRKCNGLPYVSMTYATEPQNGTWIPLTLPNVQTTPHLTVADFDGDGLTDVIQPNFPPQGVWLNRFADPRATTPAHAMQLQNVTVQSQGGPD